MEVGKLTVEKRNSSGKNEARRLRAAGKVPGICYGPGLEPILISVDPRELKRALDPEKRANTVIHATLAGDAKGGEGPRTLTVMLKDYQVDAIRRDVQHVDLIAVDVNKEVTVEIPVILVGKPVGVVDGGQLHAVFRRLSVSCKPEAIPVKIEADVSALKIGDVLHAGDLKLPAGVKLALSAGETIASVVAPKAEKTAAEEAAEAAVAAEAAAGAVPAAPGAPGAAAAPAKGAEAKGPEAKPAKEEKKK